MDIAALLKLFTSVGLAATMLAIGLRAPLAEVIKAAKQTRPILLTLVANFLLVPIATLGLLALFDPEPMIAIGFLILAVCPGAPVGPLFAGIARGDVAAAIGQMVILAGVSAVLSPVLLSLLLDRYGSDVHISYSAIIRSLLVTQLAPLAIGIAIREAAPTLAAGGAKPFSACANVLLVTVFIVLIVHQLETLQEVRLRGWLGMLLLLAVSLAIGWLCGGPTQATRKTLALTTAVRNAAVGLVIATSNFAGTAASTVVVAYALTSILGALACAWLFGAWLTDAEQSSGSV